MDTRLHKHNTLNMICRHGGLRKINLAPLLSNIIMYRRLFYLPYRIIMIERYAIAFFCKISRILIIFILLFCVYAYIV